MIQGIIKILKIVAILTLLLGGLYILGSTINNLIDWDLLTNLFTVIRRFWAAANWWWEIPLMITLIGISLSMDIAEWAFRAGLLPMDWFRKND